MNFNKFIGSFSPYMVEVLQSVYSCYNLWILTIQLATQYNWESCLVALPCMDVS